MKEIEIEEFFLEWDKRKLFSGKSFEELFQIEGVSLWWFYKKFFYKHMVPKQINPFNSLLKGEKLSRLERLKFYCQAKMLKKYLWLIENKKIGEIKKIKGKEGPKKTEDKNGKILFLTYSNHILENGEIFRLKRIIQKIEEEKRLDSFVLFADPLSRRSYKKIINFENIYQYHEQEVARKAKLRAKNLAEGWRAIEEEKKREAFKFKGVSLWDYFRYAFDFYFSEEFLYFLVLYYEIFKKIIKEEKIKVIVITAAVSLFEKDLMAAAKHLKVPVIKVQHGLSLNFWRHADMIGYFKQAVGSEAIKKYLVKLGVKEENIVVVGPVVYDEILPYIGPKKKNQEFFTGEKNILIATGPMIETSRLGKKEYFERIKKVLDDFKNIKDVKIALKLHPAELYYSTYIKMIKKNKYNNVAVFPPNITKKEFYQLINGCDVLIQFFSNCAQEAMIIGRPVINLNILDFHLNSWLDIIDAVIKVDYKDDLQKVVEEALKDSEEMKKKRKEVVKEYCGRIDGRASERVVNLIYQLANR